MKEGEKTHLVQLLQGILKTLTMSWGGRRERGGRRRSMRSRRRWRSRSVRRKERGEEE
jgi:hypothetical protein